MGYGQGVIAIAKELVKRGYKPITYREARKFNKSNTLPLPAKRFFLALSTEIGDAGNAGNNLKELLDIFNSPKNKDGSLIHIMLASQKYNESIDLKAVRHIHIFEPLVTMASDLQTVGRAVRHCSFADLEYDKWVVKVHRYISSVPSTIAVDVEPQKHQLQDEINGLEAQLDALTSKDDLVEAKHELKLKMKDAKKDPSLKAEIKALEQKVREFQDKIKTSKKEAQGILDMVKGKKKHLKLISQPPKFDLAQIENIDEMIFKESREWFKALFTIYKCMREAAVDCKLMHEFHSKTKMQIKCEF